MTTLRKWRFPILIGAGLIAAGILFYVSSNRVNPEKTQGAIGKRDVYRDGQVASADVGTPGAAPVALQAVLESSEFKALAKNPAFQEVLRNQSFAELARNPVFVRLLADGTFQNLARFEAFSALIQNALNQGSSGGDKSRSGLNFAGLEQNSQYAALMNHEGFHQLVENPAFAQMAREQLFMNLLSSASFQGIMSNGIFVRLASNVSFQNALLAGSSANLVNGMMVRQ
jgi:F0F1-type ATP synthase delta subunit